MNLNQIMYKLVQVNTKDHKCTFDKGKNKTTGQTEPLNGHTYPKWKMKWDNEQTHHNPQITIIIIHVCMLMA